MEREDTFKREVTPLLQIKDAYPASESSFLADLAATRREIAV